MDVKKIIYLGVFLDEKSKTALLEQFPPMHPHIHGMHVTLAFKPTEIEIERFKPWIGQSAWINITSLRFNTKGQAVDVVIVPTNRKNENNMTEYQNFNERPFRPPEDQPLHITISTAAGIQPKYSKELVQDTLVASRPVSMHLTGVFDTWPSSIKENEEVEAEKLRISKLKPCDDCKADHADPMVAVRERLVAGVPPKGTCCEYSRRQMEKRV